MIAVFAFLAALAATPSRGIECGLIHPEACRNTNVLIFDRAFVRAIRAFVGSGQAAYLYRGTVADQQLDVLGGPPDHPVHVGDRYRFTACRDHSCDEKGAVVLEPDGRIVATAILHSRCAEPHHGDGCDDENVLTLFVRRPVGEQGVIENLTAWAREEIAAAGPGPVPWSRPRLETVEVYAAGSGPPKRVSVSKLTPG